MYIQEMIHISQADTENNKTPWIKEMEQLGIVTPPKKKGFPPENMDEYLKGRGFILLGHVEEVL